MTISRHEMAKALFKTDWPNDDWGRFKDGDHAKERYLRMADIALSAVEPQCCMCGKKGLSTVEGDGGTECELSDGRWVCSAECWDRAVEPAPSVAVKAFETNKEMLAAFGAEDIREGSRKCLGDGIEEDTWEDYYEVPFHALDCIRAALSAQVQDVAVAEIVSAHGDPEAFGERELVALVDIQKFPYRTKLYAAAPAKQEGQCNDI